jgi:uncharacterized protein (TIGR00730 family)
MKKTITIFGSSKPVDAEEQYQFAYKLGVRLAENNYNVCTGGFYGIMEAVSKGAIERGADTIGVTVDLWGVKPNNYVTREIKCNSIFERIEKLINCADAYIILQGGTGTLLEFASVWELSNKGLMNHKPIVCHSSMWQGIISIMNIQMEYEGRNTDLVKVAENVDEIISYLETNIQ